MKRFLFTLVAAVALFSGCYEMPQGGKPPPSPVITKSDSLWILVVDDFAQRAGDANARQLLSDGGYWQKIHDRGHHYRLIDAGNDSAVKYQKQVNEVGGLPCAILADFKTSKEFAAVKLPADAAGMDALISKYSDK